MKNKKIILSPQHGLNPAVPLCFFCGKEKNEIILAGQLKGDVEAPRGVAWDRSPCETCAGYMQQGIILISVRDGEGGENPYRTGAFVVVTEDAIRRLIRTELVEDILRVRVCFVPDNVWDIMGLPRTVRMEN